MEKEYGIGFIRKIKIGIVVVMVTVVLGVLGYVSSDTSHGYEKRTGTYVSSGVVSDALTFGSGSNV